MRQDRLATPVESLPGSGATIGVSGIARVVANALPASIAAAGVSPVEKRRSPWRRPRARATPSAPRLWPVAGRLARLDFGQLIAAVENAPPVSAADVIGVRLMEALG